MADNQHDDDQQETFDRADSGATQFIPVMCSSLRKNGFVLLKDKPCKIVEMTTSKTGKHGHAKVHLVGIDIFTQKKHEDLCPSTHNMNVPTVTRVDYQFVDSQNGFLTIMHKDSGDIREDLKHPDNEIGNEITERQEKDEDFMVTVLSAMGSEMVCGTKVLT